jgi:hypothetical protein
MNPSSPSVASRPNTSIAIQSAHAALTEKAREQTYIMNAAAKRIEASPERSLIKGATHKRMQSLQTGSVRDLSNLLEGGSSFGTPKSPEKIKPVTPHASKEFMIEGRSPEKETNCSETPTPNNRDTPNHDTPTLRPSLRRPPQSIFGENTPPQSATMLALQNMASRDLDTPLLNVTNKSTALVRTPQTFDAISGQILSLTSIATNLQKEMAQLNRRSRDNATDLVSLKEATKARDEDIRRSLRELVSNLSEPAAHLPSSVQGGCGLYLDNKAYNNSPGSRSVKPFTLPRIPSPASFAASLDRETMITPSTYNSDGVASIAILEKILRDMGTKEGQDLLVLRLTEVSDRLAQDSMSTAKKLDDLIQFVKNNSAPQDIVTHDGGGGNNTRPRNFSFEQTSRPELEYDHRTSGPALARVEAVLGQETNKDNIAASGPTRAAEIINEDVLKIIRTVKDSVAQGGGLTAEVKALVRELRGEVLGMGREIGRKLDEANSKNDTAKDVGDEEDHVARIVQDGLEELKEHMDRIMQENRRQSSSSSVSRNPVDYREIYNAVRSAVNENPQEPGLEKEDIIEAVKEAWENYKPDIELQHFGLEREELLACLKEGIQEYAPQNDPRAIGGATRDEVFTAVVEGLKHFAPPRVETEASLSREEILDAVRECLEEFEFPSAPLPEPREPNITREDMLDAVKEGLHTFDFAANTTAVSCEVGGGLTRDDLFDAIANREPDITRDDMLDAVKEGLHTFDFAANTTAVSREVGGGLTRDDLFDAIKASRGDFSIQGDAFGQQVFERLQEITETLKTEFKAVSDEAKQNVAAHGRDTEQVLDATKDGFDRLRADIEAYVDRVADISVKDEILDSVHESFNGLREELEQLLSKGSDSSIESVRNELELLRESMAKSLVPGGGSPDKEEIIQALRYGLDGLRADIQHSRASTDNEVIVEALRYGLDGLRADIERVGGSVDKDEIIDILRDGLDGLRADIQHSSASADKEEIIETLRDCLDGLRADIERAGRSADKEEIIEALKVGLDGLRADIERPRGGNESILSGTGEILDALHDGLNGLRSEVEKIGNKPVDMTVNYEILDTLKAGLEGVRADIDRLREGGYDERAVAAITDGAVIPAEGLKRNDIENLEVLITQLRIKVEALESMPPPPAQPVPASLSKSDLAAVEEMLRSVHESVAGMSDRDLSDDGDAVKKEDVVAIETLLRNTKAKIDEMDPEQAVKKDHLDSVAAIVGETRESVNELTSHLQDVSKKDDMSIIESLVRDVILALEEMKVHAAKDADDAEKVTKTDVEAVEALCLDVKSAIEQMVSADIAALASKEDVKNLEELVKEFKDRIETHAETNAKAFDDRQAETVDVGERVTEVKTFLEEFKEAIKEKLDEGATSVEALGKFLEGIGETIGQNANITDDIKEMFETMKVEFEKSNAGVVGSKLETDEKFQQTWDKFDAKLDEKFNELMTKYDDAQLSAEAREKLGEEKIAGVEAAALGTKAVAEDLKLLVDTLSTTLTESVEKMDEASKTVFNRVEDTFTRVEETHADAKEEHQLTREQVSKTLGAIEGVQTHVTEYNPKILESIKDVLLIVGQHYEHSKSATTTLEEKIAERPPPVETPLLSDILREIPVPEKYDDTQVHEKLDKLVDHMHEAGKSFAQLDTLDKIHQKVIQTAAEVSEFVSAQTQRIANDYEDKEKAAEAAAIALEKSLTQKEHVDATVLGLREEEDRLKESVAILKAEQENLTQQKMRLSADVSSLETALKIRREELHTMEARAEGLERRILESVIDHSRVLLMSKTNKGREAMSRKRVPSHATSRTGSGISNPASRTTSFSTNATQSALSMAMGGNRALVKLPFDNPAGASRRILSLNQINNNVPTGGFTRSHSVKGIGRSGSLRKASWGGSLSRGYGDLNKENLELKESEEEDDRSEDGEGSDDETMRRTSRGTTILTSTEVSESIDDGTDWSGSVDGESHVGEESMELALYEPSGDVV